jgi:tripartite-type tricarboxylate transporter receptor subunit TctC
MSALPMNLPSSSIGSGSTMTIRLKHLALAFAAAAGLASTPLSAWAQQSDKPLHIVVPFAPGGAQDVIARYLGAKLGVKLGQPVIIDNRAGAAGIVAADVVAKATDGATVLLATGGAITIAPHLQAKLPYDPVHDLVPVALVADTPMTLSVRAESPYKTVADVLRDAKARPGQVSFASTGNGTVSNLTGALLAQAAGVHLLHVPYRGASPAMTDLMGGQVATIVTSVASIEPLVASGKARVLGTFSRAELPGMGSAPTIAEATGLPGMEVPVWVGVMAPARMPAASIQKLSAALLEVCKLPETRQQFAQLGAVDTCGGPEALDKVVTEDSQRWAKVIAQGGIKSD